MRTLLIILFLMMLNSAFSSVIQKSDYLKIIIDSGLERLVLIKTPDTSGNIYLKYLNIPINVCGLSLNSLSTKIKSLYIKQNIYRRPVVSVKKLPKININISGAVFDCGRFSFSTWEGLGSFLLKNSIKKTWNAKILSIDNKEITKNMKEILNNKGELYGIKEIILL